MSTSQHQSAVWDTSESDGFVVGDKGTGDSLRRIGRDVDVHAGNAIVQTGGAAETRRQVLHQLQARTLLLELYAPRRARHNTSAALVL